jgi:hypothetical protein
MILKKLKLILKILFLKKETYNRVYLNQRIKGIKKYGKPLEKCNLQDYNWEEMIQEEIIDAFQYLEMLEKI